jgi:iron complex transport system substrate-binding protein
VTRPRFDTSAASGEIDRSIRGLLAQALSVYVVDVDRLAELAPDLIVTQVQCEVCAVSLDDVQAAIGAGLPSRPAIVSMRPDTLADVWADMRAIAGALGVPERGVQLVTRLRARMRGIAERARPLPRPRAVCIEWIDPLMVAGHWTPELLDMAGAQDALRPPNAGEPGRPAGHGRIAFDELAAADPDVLWIAPCGFDLARTRDEMATLAAEPGWGSLAAVRSGRVFLGDGNALFNRPGPRVVEAVECLAEAMHPEAFRFGHEGRGWERWVAVQQGARPADGIRSAARTPNGGSAA